MWWEAIERTILPNILITISLPVDLESYDCKEDASKTCERLIQAWPTAWDLHVKPKKKRIHSGIYSATVMEVDTWLIFRECLLSLGLVNRTLSLFAEALEGQIIEY